MKTFVPVLALAAGVSATFKNAPVFNFPGNTNNQCTDKQKPGFSWDDLDFGDFFDYKDFNFKGWKCEDDGDKRGRFAPRTGKKAIGGTCFSDKKKSPSFGCGPKVDKFSLGHIVVKPEFDCDLEFHYDMPDGSLCKHRTPCKKSGTKVVNRQCGGAKNVTIIYPPQPNKPKPSCSIKVPTISFDCSTASSTKPPKTRTKKPDTTTTPPAQATTTKAEETSTTEAADSSSSVAPGDSTSATATPGVTLTSSDSPVQQTSSSVAPGQESSSSAVPDQETSTSVVPGQESSSSAAEESSTSEAPVTKTLTTSYDSTSTIFTTSTQTVTQCEPTVSDCPAGSVTTTVVTIAVSTTICPVTETLTTVESNLPVTSPTGVATTSDAVATSAKPIETLPCPSVVPSCLNTFLLNLDCADNTDAACYCPDAAFVKNVYECLYAHGETDSIIAEAIAYFQGICGKWVSENPAIATDATVTSYITVTATPTVAPVYTTITVDVTTVVPCTDEAGEEIPSSSTTVTVSTSMTLPAVDFTTGSTGGVDIIPITSAPSVTVTPGGSPSGAPEVISSVVPTGIQTPPGAVITANGTTLLVPTGTGSLLPTNSIVTAGSGRVGASFGLAAAVALVAAVAL